MFAPEFKIPYSLISEEYIQLPALKKFCSTHRMRTNENMTELIKQIEEFASQSEDNYYEVLEWIDNIVKEGSKELIFVEVGNINQLFKNEKMLNKLLNKTYPDLEGVYLCEFKNNENMRLVNYTYETDGNNNVSVVSLIFSRIYLQSSVIDVTGDRVIYPVFIDIYLEQGLLFARYKSKGTLYEIEEDDVVLTTNKINTLKNALSVVMGVSNSLNLKVNLEKKEMESNVGKLIYRLYEKYSFTPEEIESQISTVENSCEEFVKELFDVLELSPMNIPDACEDMRIFIEKYISINGDNEHIFKEKRDAYLIKVQNDDKEDLTRIDASSADFLPLQCTSIFFDSKKSIKKSRNCERIHLCFKRKDTRYFGADFKAYFYYDKYYGIVKLPQYVEECDINYVIQTVFENY